MKGLIIFLTVGQGFSLAKKYLEEKFKARLKPCPTIMLLDAVLYMKYSFFQW